MSRAVSDNLHCALPREHPISKQWAKELPPLTDNFYVTRQALFEFLTKQLTPEPQDLHDRTHKRLMEPKSVQELYDLSKTVTDEERYYTALRLLDQWNDKYLETESKNSKNNSNHVRTAPLRNRKKLPPESDESDAEAYEAELEMSAQKLRARKARFEQLEMTKWPRNFMPPNCN
jgi:hypothetical protein